MNIERMPEFMTLWFIPLNSPLQTTILPTEQNLREKQYPIIKIAKGTRTEAIKIAQQLRVFAVPAKNPGLDPSTQSKWLTTACIPSFRGPSNLSWPSVSTHK